MRKTPGLIKIIEMRESNDLLEEFMRSITIINSIIDKKEFVEYVLSFSSVSSQEKILKNYMVFILKAFEDIEIHFDYLADIQSDVTSYMEIIIKSICELYEPYSSNNRSILEFQILSYLMILETSLKHILDLILGTLF